MANLEEIIKKSFIQYAGAVLQSRALVDVRDCMKPSARQIFYCLYTDKFISSKPFKKTLKAVGSASRAYIHGDASCIGILMRAAQPFSLRYPLIEVEGSYGNLMESGNYSAPRYTSCRLSPLADYLFKDIDKDTVVDWRLNYDNTESLPAVLPTKGFFNIVNGTSGIGVGAASSIPSFNLNDVNNALITLIKNPEASFEEIYCAPDFPTGGILLNEAEVKESLKNGTGSSCKLRSIITFNDKERCLEVTEIPYSVYTNTICKELESIINSDDDLGIERFNDLTGSTPLIKIYLSKKANINKVIKYLYKNTSLQSFYGVNMTMLEEGRFPRIYGWKELLLSHINYEKEVYRRGYEFQLNKDKKRVHIVNGLLICLASIDEVIEVIKKSKNTTDAKNALCDKFLLDEEQAKAVLDIKLSRLARLEVEKLENEKKALDEEINWLESILTNEELFNNELIKSWEETKRLFGDERRTKVLNIETETSEVVEKKGIILNLTNKNNLIINESSSLYVQKRGGVGGKIKLDKDEYVVHSAIGNTTDKVLFFDTMGYEYIYSAAELSLDSKIPIETIVNTEGKITSFAFTNEENKTSNIYFITKKGFVKKGIFEDYINVKRQKSRAIELNEKDEIIKIVFGGENLNLGLLSKDGYCLIFNTKSINAVGKKTKGLRGINLSDNDELVCAEEIKNNVQFLVTVTKNGQIKRTKIGEISIGSRGNKGSKIHKTKDGESMAAFYPISTEKYVYVMSSAAQIKIDIDNIPVLGKNCYGVQSIKLKEKEKIIGISGE